MLQKFKEKIKIKEKPEYQPNYKGTTLIESYGSGYKNGRYKHEQLWFGHHTECLDDVDIALISYLQTRYCLHERVEFLEGWAGIGKYNNKYLNENIHEGPLGFIMPYLYDEDYGMGIIDSGWDKIDSIDIYQFDEEGEKHKIEIPKIYELFSTLSELIDYIKQEMPKVRPSICEDYYGVLLQPWEIDEAREVLKKAGWDNQELRYLRWIGKCRGFGACIEVHQMYVDIINKHLDLSNNDVKFAWSHILEGLQIANKKCTNLGWNGPDGLCGTYIYRITPEVNLDDLEERDIITLDDGRKYVLCEGD